MTFEFDLQLFGGGANSQQNNADQYYQQEANAANQMVGNFNSIDLPALQHLMPLLLGTLNGSNSTLMQAAEAPVNAQTASTINTLKSNPAGVVNPNALYSDMALTGQTEAGLAGDQMLTGVLSALQNLIGLGYGGAQSGMGGLGSAAGGEADLGGQLNQQGNQWWQSLLGAAGTYAGLASGGKGGGGSKGTQSSSIFPSGGLNAAMPSSSAQSPAMAPSGIGGPYGWFTGAQASAPQPSMPISSSSVGPKP